MADHPILFSPPMVRGLIREIEQSGNGKTQTRRVITPRRNHSLFDGTWSDSYVLDPGNANWRADDIPYHIGDRLWCREEHYQFGHWEIDPLKRTAGGRDKWRFVADRYDVLFDPPENFRKGRHHNDPATPDWHKRLGRFMFRRHSRLTLYVTEVRVERLQSINESDAVAEGLRWCAPGKFYVDRALPIIGDDPRLVYRDLWEHLNGIGTWAQNPFVSAYTFVPCLGNIDALPATLAEAA